VSGDFFGPGTSREEAGQLAGQVLALGYVRRHQAGEMIAFWRDRLDEEEAIAKTAARKRRAPWRVFGRYRMSVVSASPNPDLGVAETYGVKGELATHIALHCPARELDELAAKRAVLDLYARTVAARDAAAVTPGPAGARDFLDAERELVVLEVVVRQHVAVHRRHPDYRSEWAPEVE